MDDYFLIMDKEEEEKEGDVPETEDARASPPPTSAIFVLLSG
jgi:hypothetical protein